MPSLVIEIIIHNSIINFSVSPSQSALAGSRARVMSFSATDPQMGSFSGCHLVLFSTFSSLSSNTHFASISLSGPVILPTFLYREEPGKVYSMSPHSVSKGRRRLPVVSKHFTAHLVM